MELLQPELCLNFIFVCISRCTKLLSFSETKNIIYSDDESSSVSIKLEPLKINYSYRKEDFNSLAKESIISFYQLDANGYDTNNPNLHILLDYYKKHKKSLLKIYKSLDSGIFILNKLSLISNSQRIFLEAGEYSINDLIYHFYFLATCGAKDKLYIMRKCTVNKSDNDTITCYFDFI